MGFDVERAHAWRAMQAAVGRRSVCAGGGQALCRWIETVARSLDSCHEGCWKSAWIALQLPARGELDKDFLVRAVVKSAFSIHLPGPSDSPRINNVPLEMVGETRSDPAL